MNHPPTGPSGEPSRAPIIGPAIPNRTPTAPPAEGRHALIAPFVARRAPIEGPAPAEAAPPPPDDDVTAGESAAPFSSWLTSDSPIDLPALVGGVPEVSLDDPMTGLPHDEASEPAAPALDAAEPDAVTAAEPMGELADRLEGIASSLRRRDPESILAASGDPLETLILGYLLGYREAARRSGSGPRDG